MFVQIDGDGDGDEDEGYPASTLLICCPFDMRCAQEETRGNNEDMWPSICGPMKMCQVGSGAQIGFFF
ncbi:hypothetical protein HanHA300_Chr08g0283471 [Helianthus annuus]|nr:hypothetical protein HanHA300_Chr08g0283471 [Helianthus annuus]KAJ0553835.1 hypothetical protein HanHA89_Chr08g0300861 [Helianthus annuus]KAJ0722720.1 hypothetical protein HanOQP8_Chr08g0289861 [Helianthus annuus]